MAMSISKVVPVFLCILAFCPGPYVAKKNYAKNNLLNSVSDHKEFKKLLRTHNNVLVIFLKKASDLNIQLYGEVAENMKGEATITTVDCSDAKKLCKKLKVSPDAEPEIKHYKDGDFNRNYDRKHSVKSLMSFLKDPTGDIPWEEEALAKDVVHIDSPQTLGKLLSKERKPILLMFYAPWCGFCKRLKPDYAEAASELKGDYVLAGMDVDKQENYPVRVGYNITGFPTIFYFENGEKKFKYGGENNKEGIISWMKDPQPPKEQEKELEWADEESHVVHLSEDDFDTFMEANPSVLVMFYAPWCGHCKKMKPEYAEAAELLHDDGVEGVLAAVDAAKEKVLGERFGIKGFPSLKYFKDGEVAWDYNERTGEKIVEFMKNPEEPPPPPAPEAAWDEIESSVNHLGDDNFKQFLKKKKHALVMFYAPWCGHCKKAKPEFTAAADTFTADNKVAFAACDCTKHTASCQSFEITGYPTFRYFNYGKDDKPYNGGRVEADFIAFMKDPSNPNPGKPPTPSPEAHWSDAEGHENVKHLTAENFESTLAEHKSVLVMFYAPWCGHCKSMKPAYAEAATELKDSETPGILAAVDATQEEALTKKFDIRGFPTVKYFKDGAFAFDYDKKRSKEDFLSFMKNPAASPPPEPAWADIPSNVDHLTEGNFKEFTKSKDDVLVMFYAPWCGHCKKMKPEFQEAADDLISATGKSLAAVDCTTNTDLCKDKGVSGYPTLQYFHKGNFVEIYKGGRTKPDFVKFFESPPRPKEEL